MALLLDSSVSPYGNEIGFQDDIAGAELYGDALIVDQMLYDLTCEFVCRTTGRWSQYA